MFRLRLFFISFFSFSTTFAQTGFQQNSVAGNENGLPLAEKIFVNTDKSFYVSGEVLWFKVYVMNAVSHQLQNISHTAFIELVNRNNQAVLQGKVSVDAGTGSGSFYLPSTLESGSFILRAYTNWMKNDPAGIFEKTVTVINTRKEIDTSELNLGMRLPAANGFAGKDLKNNAALHTIQVTTNQATYQPRSAVSVRLLNTDSTRLLNLSASVYHVSELNQPGRDLNFPKYLSATSGNVPVKNNSLHQGHLEFLPDMNGMVVTVVAKKSGTGVPAPDVPVYISARGKLANVQVGYTDNDGKAYFNFKDLYGSTQLVLQTDPEFQSGVDLSIDKPYLNVDLPSSFAANNTFQPESESALEALHNHTLVDDAYFGSKIDSFAVTNNDSLSFYGKPYKTYLLDNYKRFVTMEEVLREYVAEVNVRIRNKNYHFQTFNRQFFDLGKYLTLDYMMTQGTPLVLLDGVPVFDNNKIIEYNPLLVRKLEVMADRFHIGRRAWNGVMSFVTYDGDLKDFKLEPKDVVVDFDGWQRPRNFYTPNYSVPETRNSRIPDFRNVLYWNPEINVGNAQTLHFFTGDLTGTFVVVVQGISDTGAPVFETTTFKVKR